MPADIILFSRNRLGNAQVDVSAIREHAAYVRSAPSGQVVSSHLHDGRRRRRRVSTPPMPKPIEAQAFLALLKSLRLYFLCLQHRQVSFLAM